MIVERLGLEGKGEPTSHTTVNSNLCQRWIAFLQQCFIKIAASSRSFAFMCALINPFDFIVGTKSLFLNNSFGSTIIFQAYLTMLGSVVEYINDGNF